MSTNLSTPDRWIVTDGLGPAGSHQTIWRCANGYGASVIRGGYAAYGGYELAVIRFEGEGSEWHLTYDTPITDDVIGHLDDAECERLLDAIAALPAPVDA